MKNVRCILRVIIQMIGENTDEIIHEHFDSLLHRYQTDLVQSIKYSNFVFDYANGLHNKCYKY